MKYPVLNQKGEKIEEISLSEKIFGVKINKDLMHQVIVSQQANKRQGNAHTKGRGEVRGGGRKPWKQKGLGRARHGSSRSPIWIGGGTTFGPINEKIFERKIPKKMKRKAMFMGLSSKVECKDLILMDDIKISKSKTKLVLSILNNIIPEKKKSLIVLPGLNESIILATRNIPYLKTIQAKDLSCLDILSCKNLIVLKESVDVIEKVFLKVNKEK